MAPNPNPTMNATYHAQPDVQPCGFAVANAQAIITQVDKAGAAVAALADKYGTFATTMKSVGVNLPGGDTAALVKDTAGKVTVEKDIIQLIQGVSHATPLLPMTRKKV